MATMSSSSRESMILSAPNGNYRLPTVREAASMMSFPIDYQFYGLSKGTKHTLVGNAVPPKMSYAIAKSIALDAGEPIPNQYIPIHHNPDVVFYNLNNVIFEPNEEKTKRDIAKFKYHIPYLIKNAFRVELTNCNSDFDNKIFKWDVEIHYSQGKNKARIFCPRIEHELWDKKLLIEWNKFIVDATAKMCKSHNYFQEVHCMTSVARAEANIVGPFELLSLVREYIDKFSLEDRQIYISDELPGLPEAIGVGYYILKQLISTMNDGFHK